MRTINTKDTFTILIRIALIANTPSPLSYELALQLTEGLGMQLLFTLIVPCGQTTTEIF